MTGSNRKRDAHGGADPYSRLSRAQERRKLTYPLVIGATVLVVAACALIAVLATRSDDDASSAAKEGSGAAAAADSKQETAAVTVTGEPLPEMPSSTGSSPFTSASDDPAIGAAAPKIEGETFDGSKVTIDPADGTPKVIVFVAHWCPHCQKEVPLIQEWIDEGNLPEGVEIVFVSTAVSEDRPNYPPSAWIADEGITSQVVLDDDQSAAASDYGLTSFPYFVMTNGQGQVVARGSGEVPMAQFGAAVDALAEGEDPAAAAG
ncbi:TlpA family protein disulfide reductase [Dermatobacter hominis]|uniref:TlpA family protein disulfide reductase n=1 Tax=Dermatobacter hominis TaxID=2884263 RepID=UPI001D12D3FB|nr:TlpA disulfide reductase family protein [Dermatobacter hominis]UDY35432.1 TlpA family protein disulfide reductase [Dermatobacter hominis]